MVSIIEKLGLVSLLVLTIRLSCHISTYVYKTRKYPQNRKLKDMGEWAVVLGADLSIGQAYAWHLGKQGLNVVLIGADYKHLMAVSNAIENCLKVATGVLILEKSSASTFRRIERALCFLDIAILVNAPGYGPAYPRPERFLDIPSRDAIFSSVSNNIMTITQMCAVVMPGMVSRGRGVVVNVSSMAASTPCPMLALHGAAAAYIEKLSEELRNEYASTGVIVQTLLPGYILQKRCARQTQSWMTPSSHDYVASAIKRIGIQDSTCGYTPHSLLYILLKSLKALCPKTTVSIIRKVMENVRAQLCRQESDPQLMALALKA